MFNTLKHLLGLSSTPNSQPVNPNPLALLYNHRQSYPQPGNYMYWNGLPNHQGIILATVGLQSSYVCYLGNLYPMPGVPGMYAQAHGPINHGKRYFPLQVIYC